MGGEMVERDAREGMVEVAGSLDRLPRLQLCGGVVYVTAASDHAGLS